MELVFVRHALPVRVDRAPDGGPADPGLAPAGVAQAERLVAALRDDRPAAVYSSPMRRALETADPLARELGLAPVVAAGLAEFDSEHPSYVPVEELRAAGDPRWHALVAGRLQDSGVDPGQFRRRVVAAVEEIVAAHPGERVVLVSHSGTINAYAGHVLEQSRPMWFAPAYGSVNRLGAARDGRRGVVSLNETGHVRDLLELRM